MWGRIIRPYWTPKMTRPTVKSLITKDLGYCCLWFFFKHYRNTALIAARLGVTQRAVQIAKAEAREGCCEGRPGCLNAKITLEGSPRKVRSSCMRQ